LIYRLKKNNEMKTITFRSDFRGKDHRWQGLERDRYNASFELGRARAKLLDTLASALALDATDDCGESGEFHFEPPLPGMVGGLRVDVLAARLHEDGTKLLVRRGCDEDGDVRDEFEADCSDADSDTVSEMARSVISANLDVAVDDGRRTRP